MNQFIQVVLSIVIALTVAVGGFFVVQELDLLGTQRIAKLETQVKMLEKKAMKTDANFKNLLRNLNGAFKKMGSNDNYLFNAIKTGDCKNTKQVCEVENHYRSAHKLKALDCKRAVKQCMKGK